MSQGDGNGRAGQSKAIEMTSALGVRSGIEEEEEKIA